MSLLTLNRSTDSRHRTSGTRGPKPVLECLEERTVLSHTAAVPDLSGVVGALLKGAPGGVVINSITPQSDAVVNLANGVLNVSALDQSIADVTGTIGNLPFTTTLSQLTLAAATPDQAANGVCTVLHLALAPINLDVPLLGVSVNTSAICLDITAQEGQGLLGSLLCNIVDSGLGGLDLGDIGGLLGNSTLTSGLSSILTTALSQAHPGGGGGNDPSVCPPGNCELLHLTLGPVDLDVTLLGVSVGLDNCAGGPIQVCLSAVPGQGLLGSLLCDLVDGGLLDDINVNQLAKVIRQATDFVADGVLSPQEAGKLLQSIGKLIR